ncbi:MAG: HipA domain-containing protein [Micrococcales bacterium]|nr:HipA domain-containing protein [Micrococcales bacterium]MCL2669015.1 HipA domain-containing protein [Micrococcales bacterium]
MPRLHLLMDGHLLGDVDGVGQRLRLRYDPEAAASAAFVPLSVNMPATKGRWRGAPLRTWLEGVLPDREGVVRRWRAQFGVTDTYPESLLEHVGEDLAGAAQLVRPDRLDTVLQRDGTVTPLDEADIADVVQAARGDTLPYDPGTSTGRFSLAGAQAKFALQRTNTGWALPGGAEPSTHIFKLAIDGLVDQDITEVLTMRTASLLGLPTAHAFVTELGDDRVIGVERYDRIQIDGRWHRVHQEDLCQATGTHPLHKYESQGGLDVVGCADLIRLHCGPQDVERFAQAIIFNYLVRGSDAHARNYSLLLTPSEVRLAPLYDLNMTFSFGERWARRMAMRVGGEDHFDLIDARHWRRFAGNLGLDPGWTIDQLLAMTQHLPDALATVATELDLATIAPATYAAVADRAAQWCQTAASRTRR